MQWKMNENSLFAILLRSPWWISAAIAAGLCGLALAVLPATWRAVGLFSGAPFLVIAVIALSRQLRAPSAKRVGATLDAVRAMSWNAFADALQQGYRGDGYEVTRIDAGAADFEIAKEGRRSVVCGRRWKAARTGLAPLEELVALREAREAREAIYVLGGELSDPARAFAAKERVTLVGGADLAKLLPDASHASRSRPAR